MVPTPKPTACLPPDSRSIAGSAADRSETEREGFAFTPTAPGGASYAPNIPMHSAPLHFSVASLSGHQYRKPSPPSPPPVTRYYDLETSEEFLRAISELVRCKKYAFEVKVSRLRKGKKTIYILRFGNDDTGFLHPLGPASLEEDSSPVSGTYEINDTSGPLDLECEGEEEEKGEEGGGGEAAVEELEEELKKELEQYAREEAGEKADKEDENGREGVSQVEHHLIYDIKRSSAGPSRNMEEPQANFDSPRAKSPVEEPSKTFDSSDSTDIFGDPKPSSCPVPRTLATPKPVTLIAPSPTPITRAIATPTSATRAVATISIVHATIPDMADNGGVPIAALDDGALAVHSDGYLPGPNRDTLEPRSTPGPSDELAAGFLPCWPEPQPRQSRRGRRGDYSQQNPSKGGRRDDHNQHNNNRSSRQGNQGQQNNNRGGLSGQNQQKANKGSRCDNQSNLGGPRSGQNQKHSNQGGRPGNQNPQKSSQDGRNGRSRDSNNTGGGYVHSSRSRLVGNMTDRAYEQPNPFIVRSRPPQRIVSRAEVGVFVQGVPPNVSPHSIYPEIHGGAVHSVVFFKAPASDGDKKAAVYFKDSASADRFAAWHKRQPIRLMGFKLSVSREFPQEVQDVFASQHLEPFRADETRCLVMKGLPENRYPAVSISRWIDNQLPKKNTIENIEFDHSTATAYLRFTSIRAARFAMSDLVRAKAQNTDWSHCRIEFTSDPCGFVC